MFITQITVYLENTHGTLRALTKPLAKENIDMLALSVADTASFGLVRIITRENDCDRAFRVLQENGFLARINHVFCLSVPNEPAGLDRVLGSLRKTVFRSNICIPSTTILTALRS